MDIPYIKLIIKIKNIFRYILESISGSEVYSQLNVERRNQLIALRTVFTIGMVIVIFFATLRLFGNNIIMAADPEDSVPRKREREVDKNRSDLGHPPEMSDGRAGGSGGRPLQGGGDDPPCRGYDRASGFGGLLREEGGGR